MSVNTFATTMVAYQSSKRMSFEKYKPISNLFGGNKR